MWYILRSIAWLASMKTTFDIVALFGLNPHLLLIRRVCLMLIFAALSTSCTPRILPPAQVVQTRAPADFPEAYYREAEAAGRKVLRVDAENSLVTVNVYRGGALARLGHDHVVASHDVEGYVDIAGGRADLYVPLDRLSVDEPGLRLKAGLVTQPSLGAVEGTRRNMLEKVLESERFPFAYIQVSRAAAESKALKVTITLHGTEKTFEIPAQIEILPGGIGIGGQIKFNQTDFGIVPYSVLGGALQVQDGLELNFLIVAVAN